MWLSFSSTQRVDLLSIFFLILILRNVAAQTLGISLDGGARSDAKRVVYSAKLSFDQDTEELFNDAQLYGLARLAFQEMQGKFQRDQIRLSYRPSMVGVMAMGKVVYISSSLKGDSFIYTHADTRLKPPLTTALQRCQTSLQESPLLSSDRSHRVRASCSEVLAVQQSYLDDDVPKDQKVTAHAPRVAAFGRTGRIGPVRAQHPCEGDDEGPDGGFVTWGCRQFMNEEGIETPKRPEDADINLPSPFPTFTSRQISVACPEPKSHKL
ncbi:hypothetical protein CTRI78_v002183 [Colletotrichum trifolii]|uniref:Uncharacterized protein n=1 Tax=Colletotrichum trifolii TaxID=5466 RepID=A0A4R8RQV0_COLTR|nr:hypothetical protein CTRI78_v002183 [Colletotrichum trifolii]